jgi:hypothetical protein
VETTIADIEKKLDTELQLPTGYHYTYGGQFKNLKEAKARLLVAVPAALIIILFLLFFTLRSMREILIVFTEIPLAAIGGILALWLRGIPFSISAGVGFIALFGVVVLNGIVLINQFDELKRKGITDINRCIINGCMERLRPVLMTALVASCLWPSRQATVLRCNDLLPRWSSVVCSLPPFSRLWCCPLCTKSFQRQQRQNRYEETIYHFQPIPLSSHLSIGTKPTDDVARGVGNGCRA